jgi:hypothetical protein
MRQRRVLIAAATAAFVVVGASVGTAGADDTYQLPGDPEPVDGTECIPFPKEHALHADVSGFAATDDDGVDAAAAELVVRDPVRGAKHHGFSIDAEDNSAYSHNVWGMPVNLTDAETDRYQFRVGEARVEWIDPNYWWWGAMWRFHNTTGNLPDRSEIPVPDGAVGNPYTVTGVSFPVDWAFVEGDAPANYGDRHYLTIETDECAAYDTITTQRPGAPGNPTPTVTGWAAFWALSATRWDLGGVGAAYRDPSATFPGYGSGTPFQTGHHYNAASHHESSAAGRFYAADAPGLPMGPMVLRYDDVEEHELDHALRFTLPRDMVGPTPVWPAIYSDGSSTDPDALPMGAWLRLDLTDDEIEERVQDLIDQDVIAVDPGDDPFELSDAQRNLLDGLRTHGMILADSNAGGWSFAVDPDSRWSVLDQAVIKQLDLADFTQLVDADDMRATSGSIGSSYATWFEIS